MVRSRRTIARLPVSTWARRITTGSHEKRAQAVIRLGDLGISRPADAPECIELVFRAFGDNHGNVRGAAVWALQQLMSDEREVYEGPVGTPAVVHRRSPVLNVYLDRTIVALSAAARDSTTSVRRAAAWALWQMRTANQAEVPALYDCLRDEEEDVRATAAAALSHVTYLSSSVVARLIEVATNRVEAVKVRWPAIGALGSHSDAHPKALEALKAIVAARSSGPRLRTLAEHVIANTPRHPPAGAVEQSVAADEGPLRSAGARGASLRAAPRGRH
jgi:hypothetical protein